MMRTPEFDVAIIGGGPAGAATAAYLAKAGVNCVVFEREVFPRPHVGESLVPSSTRVFRELGFLEEMERAGFPRKYGAVWTASANSPVYSHDWNGLESCSYADICFSEREQPGAPLGYTYHVDRGKFDQLLLRHAGRLGTKIRYGTTVTEVDWEGRDVRLFHRTRDGRRTGTTTARMIVDASGRRTFLGRRLKLRVPDRVFDQYALHTWFEGYDRGTLAETKEHENFIFVHFLPIMNSWIWQIPITDYIVSIGVVTQKKHFSKSRETRARFFWDCIESRPELAGGLRRASQLRPLKEEADYSYAMKEICGDRFVLIGDAARFVDPIFSSGVSIALNSARFASQDIISAVHDGVFTKDRFVRFETVIRRGVRNWYKFIGLYYRLNVLFTAFIRDPRYRIDVLKLLQGDVYDEDEPEVLHRMGALVRQVENDPEHFWHPYLGDVRADDLAMAL